ncbi:ATP-dependent RNA helicase [Blastocladiella emersonii ATCC 22665]|nr:ATP-dependent RNA helicase [Blastocladiella emersonii ATCC 22665]
MKQSAKPAKRAAPAPAGANKKQRKNFFNAPGKKAAKAAADAAEPTATAEEPVAEAEAAASDDTTLDLSAMDSWGWKPVPIPKGALLSSSGSDDSSGFMMLEELSGVELVTTGSDREGKLISFKKATPAAAGAAGKKSRKAKKAAAEEEDILAAAAAAASVASDCPFTEEEMAAMGFIHVDTILDDDHPDDVKRLKRQAANEAARLAAEQQDDESDDEEEEEDASDFDMAAAGDDDESDVEIVSGSEDGEGWGTSSDAEADAADSDDDDEEAAEQAPATDAMDVDSDAEPEEEHDVSEVSPATAPTPAATPAATLAAPVPRPEPAAPEFDADMASAWTAASPKLSAWLVKGLSDLGFTSPTAIQAKSLPLAIDRTRNVVGAAETGSGKTLAFGLPILNYIATSRVVLHQPVGLILSPTRELALQITEHLRAVAKPFSFSHKLNRVNIVPLVGGFSEEKQRRLLAADPHIIVATPGRLWDLIESGQFDADKVQAVKFLVLDEADKMLEKGKFKELENLVGLLTAKVITSEWSADDTALAGGAGLAGDAKQPQQPQRQMLVFSATLPTSGPTYTFRGKPLTLKLLLSKLKLKTYATVDVTGGDKGTAANLIESRIDTSAEDKDAVLYYLLSRYPGRTLVFVNAISSIRRLVPILGHLRMAVYPLHAQMQQRQRVKNLERFAASDNGILIASDVASRGLDIKNIDHVIHYQVPQTTDLYVHRSGRTARANAEGLSIVLVTPKELPAYRKICTQLDKSAIPEFPVEVQFLAAFRKRFNLAKQLDLLGHAKQKEAHAKSWERKMAEALEVDLSEDEVDSDEERRATDRTQSEAMRLRSQLDALLERAILPRGTKRRYINAGLAEALNTSANKAMPTVAQSALQELRVLRKQKRTDQKKVKKGVA